MHVLLDVVLVGLVALLTFAGLGELADHSHTLALIAGFSLLILLSLRGAR